MIKIDMDSKVIYSDENHGERACFGIVRLEGDDEAIISELTGVIAELITNNEYAPLYERAFKIALDWVENEKSK